MPDKAAPEGLVVAAHGRHFQVLLDNSGDAPLHCYMRGKKPGPSVGDRVRIQPQGDTEGVITDILPRRNLLMRSDASRGKSFAANMDQVLLVVAPIPEFSDELLWRALVATSGAGIPPAIILNKADLPGVDEARARLAPLERLGVPVICLSALDAGQVHAALDDLLRGRSSLLLGQSGMGKSTLLNALVPTARAATQEHSTALGTGRHTTTSTRMHALPGGGWLVDSPGLQTFGLRHLSPQEVAQGFPEFSLAAAGTCRFHNCSHRHEPGCAILEALRAGDIMPRRHALYSRILAENEAGGAGAA